MLGSLLEGPPFVPELSYLVQKDPDLTSESFREIIDISALDGSMSGVGGDDKKLALVVRHWHCRDLSRLCLTSSQAWSN